MLTFVLVWNRFTVFSFLSSFFSIITPPLANPIPSPHSLPFCPLLLTHLILPPLPPKFSPLFAPFPPPSSPALLWERLDVFYVQPDPSCSPSDPVWFSSTPLERQILERLLTRVLLVRDIYTDKPLLEEDEEDHSEEEEVGGGE